MCRRLDIDAHWGAPRAYRHRLHLVHLRVRLVRARTRRPRGVVLAGPDRRLLLRVPRLRGRLLDVQLQKRPREPRAGRSRVGRRTIMRQPRIEWAAYAVLEGRMSDTGRLMRVRREGYLLDERGVEPLLYTRTEEMSDSAGAEGQADAPVRRPR